MPKIKSVSSYNGVSWSAAVPLGVDDINIDITSETVNPSIITDHVYSGESIDTNEITLLSGDTGSEAATKFNRFKNRVIYNGGIGWDGAGPHNSIYRGRNLGSSVDSWVYDEIESGRFRNLFIGDYWTINGVNWRIAAFDYWYGYKTMSNDAVTITKHHIVIVPDQILLMGFLHHTNAAETINSQTVYPTDKGYIGLDFNTRANGNTNKSILENLVYAAFGSQNILDRPIICSNAATGGVTQGWFNGTTKVDLMNELMVNGVNCWSNQIGHPYDVGLDTTQLPLFYFDRTKIISFYDGNTAPYYLRDISLGSDGKYVPCVSAYGLIAQSQVWRSGSSYGFRPAFGLMKGTT